jgi:hypothetical protein
MSRESLPGKFSFAQTAISNAIKVNTIKDVLVNFGYGESRLQEGRGLYTKAEELYYHQMRKYGKQFAATDACMKARAKAYEVYINHVKLSRLAFKNNRTICQMLQINGDRKETHSGFMQQVSAFYSNALATDEVLSGLAVYSVTRTDLERGSELVKVYQEKRREQLWEISEAQSSTEERDKAIREMDEWISDFIAVCRIAFGKSQDLEMLGIVVKR